MNMSTDLKNRLILPDCLRLLAMALMIFYHFSYDLVFFKFLNFDIMTLPFWWFLPRLIVFLFLFTAGFSLSIAHENGIQYRKFFKRFWQIVASALLISLVTYFLFPERWIYFGTLHCIALASLITVHLLNFPKILGTLGALLFLASYFGYNIPWFHLGHGSMDYVELFPWIGASFLGVFCHWYHKKSAPLKKFEDLPLFKSSSFRMLQKISAHSLLVYLIHQPVLFGLFFIVHRLFQSNIEFLR